MNKLAAKTVSAMSHTDAPRTPAASGDTNSRTLGVSNRVPAYPPEVFPCLLPGARVGAASVGVGLLV